MGRVKECADLTIESAAVNALSFPMIFKDFKEHERVKEGGSEQNSGKYFTVVFGKKFFFMVTGNHVFNVSELGLVFL